MWNVMSMLAEASLHPDTYRRQRGRGWEGGGRQCAGARTRWPGSFVRLFVRWTIVWYDEPGFRLAGTFARATTCARFSVLCARDYKSLTNEWIPFVITVVGTPVRRCSLLCAWNIAAGRRHLVFCRSARSENEAIVHTSLNDYCDPARRFRPCRTFRTHVVFVSKYYRIFLSRFDDCLALV